MQLPPRRWTSESVQAVEAVAVIEPEWPEDHDRSWGQWSPLRGAIFPGTAIYVCHKPTEPSTRD